MRHRLANPEAIGEGVISPLAVAGRALLLIRQQGVLHCLENRCGHFGLPLADGSLRPGVILCRQHGISFSLASGAVVNRPWENCDPVRVFPVLEGGGEALIDLSCLEK